jgi:flagellar hook-associated protein 1 FlgK
MTNLNGLLYTARDALTAQSYGLSVTGQNISNANTPLYARREVVLETRATGAGVDVQGTRQIIDRYADARLFTASSLESSASERDTQLDSVEGIFNDFAGGGLSDTLSALFDSFESLTENPKDSVARAQVLNAADTFASKAKEMGDSLASARDSLLTQSRDVASQVNGIAKEIAKLNGQITLAQGTKGDASNLIDRRNQQLVALSELVDVRTVQGSDGQFLVQASGATLVDGGSANKLDITLGSDSTMRVISKEQDGGNPTDVTAHLTGGRLAGLKEVRDEDLAAIIGSFDQLVYDVGSALNTQHSSGFGQDGETGRKLFDIPASPSGSARGVRLSADVAGHPERLAAAGNASTLPGGDDNALALAQLASSPIASGASATAAEAYASIVGDVGLRKAAAETDVDFRQTIRDQAESFRSSKSDVSLDEEMVSLTRYQRAYQAASKVLTTVDELLQELIQKVG